MEDKKKLNNEELKAKMKQQMDNGASLDELKAFAAEQGITINKRDMKNGPLSDEALEKVSGGIEKTDLPFYGEVKLEYLEKGPNPAFILFIYYCPSPIGYDVIKMIEDEVAAGDYSYTKADGTYYASPWYDPTFRGDKEKYRP